MKNIDLRQLAMLCTLVDCQSPTETARRMAITPSAVSQSLTRLREAMGDPLYVRDGTGYQLTPYGEIAIGAMREILSLWHGLGGKADAFVPGESDAHLVLAAHDAFGDAPQGELYRGLMEEAPWMTLDLQPCGGTQRDIAALRDGSVDLLISPFIEVPQRAGSDLCSERVAGFAITHCCLSAGHPRIGHTLSMAQYLAESHLRVATAPAPDSEPDPIDAALLAQGLPTRRCATLHAWPLCAELLAHGTRLVSVTQPQALALTRADARLKALPLPQASCWPALPVQMVWHERTGRSVTHRWLRERVRSFYRAAPASEREMALEEASNESRIVLFESRA